MGEGETKKKGLLCKSVFWESASPSGHGEVSSWFKNTFCLWGSHKKARSRERGLPGLEEGM